MASKKMSLYLCWLILPFTFVACASKPQSGVQQDSLAALEEKNPAPLISFNTSKEYLTEGIRLFDDKNYDEAIRYLDETIRQDPVSQEAYCYRGIAKLKQGNGEVARSDFEKVLSINQVTSAAVTAQEWLDRLSHPTPVDIFPIPVMVNIEQEREHTINGKSVFVEKFAGDNTPEKFRLGIKKMLSNSNLFNLVDVPSGKDDFRKKITNNKKGSYTNHVEFITEKLSARDACLIGAKSGAKISIIPKEVTITVRQKNVLPSILAPVMLVGAVADMALSVATLGATTDKIDDMGSKYEIVTQAKFDIYQTNNCNLVNSASASFSTKDIYGSDHAVSFDKMFDDIANQVSLDVYSALL